jgi:hypothetical protein
MLVLQAVATSFGLPGFFSNVRSALQIGHRDRTIAFGVAVKVGFGLMLSVKGSVGLLNLGLHVVGLERMPTELADESL